MPPTGRLSSPKGVLGEEDTVVDKALLLDRTWISGFRSPPGVRGSRCSLLSIFIYRLGGRGLVVMAEVTSRKSPSEAFFIFSVFITWTFNNDKSTTGVFGFSLITLVMQKAVPEHDANTDLREVLPALFYILKSPTRAI